MLKDFVIPLQNVWKFLKTYAQVDNRSHDGTELYFMRHAEATGQLENASLTPTGLYQLEDKSFIENILRTDPELIITSPRERAHDSAVAAQKILKQYANKEVEVIASERVVKP
jgi:phosphohistidine phosphatase SixA